MRFFKLFGFTALTLFVASIAWHVTLRTSEVTDLGRFTLMTALAEDDDDEEEEDEDEREDERSNDEENQTSKPKTVKVLKEFIEYQPVTKTIVVTEEAYSKDTDGDILVDAIDPDPLVPQNEYFTDIDGDGIPNALDRHHDEDDFTYFEVETDTNNNGLLDSYEQ